MSRARELAASPLAVEDEATHLTSGQMTPTGTGSTTPRLVAAPVAGAISPTFDDAIERYLRRFPGARGVGRATRPGGS